MAITALVSKKHRSELPPNLKRNLKLLGLAFALMLPAAIIETYVTPLLLG
jgi:stage II sporulation protein M